MATRLILIKASGSLLIHSDAGTKALNWMPGGSRMTAFAQDSESDGGPTNFLKRGFASRLALSLQGRGRPDT